MDKHPYALYLMLPLFGLIVLMSLTMEMTGTPKPYLIREGSVASVPHGPDEFKDVLDINPLEGLEPDSRKEFPVPPPPLDPEYFPCSDCHDGEADNPQKRELEEHTQVQLHHGENRWCLDCHDFKNRDVLHLADGEKIAFEESYKLCGQCHGDKYRDWRLGIHGKRTGYWNGPKRYVLCVVCHSPHDPAFKSLAPLPPRYARST